MKTVTILMVALLSLTQAFAGQISDSATAITLVPTATATRILETAAVTSFAGTGITLDAVQARGVAGKEQLKDDLVQLNDDMTSGEVKSIDQVRQPALRELFEEIQASEEEMSEIDSSSKEGTELEKISAVVMLTLLAN